MIKLINGRGQMGEAIKERLSEVPQIKESVYIYHTWNFENKSKYIQLIEFNKLLSFVDKYYKHKIIFISTTAEGDTHYTHYKQKAEAYLINKCERAIILKFPPLIGKKGILTKLKKKEVEPIGIIDLIPMDDAVDSILEKIKYRGLTRSFSFKGEMIKATTVQKLLNYE